MKFSIHSDLHTEWYNQNFWYQNATPLIVSDDTDYLILAGDIGNRETVNLYFAMLRKQYPTLKIIYVLGNHELYGGVKQLLINDYREISKKHNIIMLENDIYVDEENKCVFYGAILWSNFQLGKNKEKSMEWAKDCVADFRYIKNYKVENGYASLVNLTPEDVSKDFDSCIRKIRKTFKNEKFSGYKKIAITHFLPSKHLINPKYTDMITSAYWTSNIPKVIELADLWIYGHSHDNIHYDLHQSSTGKKVPIICNQQGYYEHLDKNNFINNYSFDYSYEF